MTSHPRFLSFSTADGRKAYGLVSGEGVIDISARLGERYPTLREVIEAGAFGEVLADEAVGVLVGTSFPGVVRVGEVDLGAESALELSLARTQVETARASGSCAHLAGAEGENAAHGDGGEHDGPAAQLQLKL